MEPPRGGREGDAGMVQVQIGVIGAGYWGPHLIRNIDEIAGVSLRGIADLNAERLRQLRTRYPDIMMTQDYRDLLESDIDAVVIATPVNTHHALALAAL